MIAPLTAEERDRLSPVVALLEREAEHLGESCQPMLSGLLHAARQTIRYLSTRLTEAPPPETPPELGAVEEAS